ncbi:hypothetical protein RQP46_003155 [Phenoliferia psychrophenolica]
MSHKSPTPTCRPAATRSGGGRARDGARVAVLLVLTAATGAGLLLFASGFFPVKPFIPGYSPASNLPVHTRLVFVLVDALRSDFAFGPSSNMPFVASLIASGHGLPFTAIAQPPTVTLPRLKALTTGSNPTFLDAMLNIAEDSDSAVLEHVDSWDTSTVDTNVTRHLDALLSGDSSTGSSAPTEWDALILHYLGMDHVGHLGGPNSPLMAPKQREMDDVVERLFTSLEAKDAEDGGSSLLVLVGDHGMSEALLFASPSSPRAPPPSSEPASNGPYLLHQVVNQIDLVPTLSVLMGLGIPRNSMGKLIEPVLEHWYPGSLEGASNLLKTNADQIGAVLTATDASATLALRCEAALVPPSQCTSFFELTSSSHFSKFIDLVQDRLLSTFGDHDLVSMSLGLSILFLTAISLAVLARPYVDSNQALVVGGAFAMFLGSRFATTFLEEEHEIWFFFTATAIGLLAISSAELKLATFVTLLASIARTANVPLFLLLWSQYRILSHLPLPPLLFTSLIIAFQRTSYFAFGGSNSLATVDLSQAYNGISTYSLPLVSLLTFLSNFAGPVFWSLATPSLLHHSQRSSTRTSHFYLSNTMHVWSLLILAISATHFRHHLFTFTVFSPALLFEGVWNTWMHLGGDVGIAFLME